MKTIKTLIFTGLAVIAGVVAVPSFGIGYFAERAYEKELKDSVKAKLTALLRAVRDDYQFCKLDVQKAEEEWKAYQVPGLEGVKPLLRRYGSMSNPTPEAVFNNRSLALFVTQARKVTTFMTDDADIASLRKLDEVLAFDPYCVKSPETRLVEAAKKGDVQSIVTLIQGGAALPPEEAFLLESYPVQLCFCTFGGCISKIKDVLAKAGYAQEQIDQLTTKLGENLKKSDELWAYMVMDTEYPREDDCEYALAKTKPAARFCRQCVPG